MKLGFDIQAFAHAINTNSGLIEMSMHNLGEILIDLKKLSRGEAQEQISSALEEYEEACKYLRIVMGIIDLMFYSRKNIAEQIDLGWIKDYLEGFSRGGKTAEIKEDDSVVLYSISGTKPSTSDKALIQLLDLAGIKYSRENPEK